MITIHLLLNLDKKYFEKLEENVKDTKETIRDLMAEHKENNP